MGSLLRGNSVFWELIELSSIFYIIFFVPQTSLTGSARISSTTPNHDAPSWRSSRRCIYWTPRIRAAASLAAAAAASGGKFPRAGVPLRKINYGSCTRNLRMPWVSLALKYPEKTVIYVDLKKREKISFLQFIVYFLSNWPGCLWLYKLVSR